MIALDKVIKSSNLLSSPIERICEIKKYLNTKKHKIHYGD